MADRTGELLLEVDTTLDGNGDYVGPWIDASGVLKGRVIYNSTEGAGVEQSNDATNVFGGVGVASGTEFPVTARYIRFVLDAPSGQANAPFRLAIKAIA